ncbi:MAG: hypothetical protein ACR2P4_00665 [Gammaproteobacteria bacterium]
MNRSPFQGFNNAAPCRTRVDSCLRRNDEKGGNDGVFAGMTGFC